MRAWSRGRAEAMSAQASWTEALTRCGRVTAGLVGDRIPARGSDAVGVRRDEPVPKGRRALAVRPGFATIAAGAAPSRAEGTPAPAAGWEVEGPRHRCHRHERRPAPADDDPQGWRRGTAALAARPGTARAPSSSRTPSAATNIAGGRPGFKVGEITLVADGDIQRTFFHPMHRLANLRGSRPPMRYVAHLQVPQRGRARRARHPPARCHGRAQRR